MIPQVMAGYGMMMTSLSPDQFAQVKRNRSRPEPVEIWKGRNYIEEHADEQISLTEVAKAVNISPNYFSEKFKEAIGVNFVEYVARIRYEKAAAMLRDANLRVSEIGFAAGFQSLSQFNRVFKKLSGKSPTEFRAAARRRERKRA